MAMRSKKIHVALLLASVALAGCGESTTSKNYGEGMTFSSFEDCAVNIGPDNCQKDPKTTVINNGGGTSTSGGSVHSSFVFMPIPSFGGGYLNTAPRAQPGYVPSSPVFAAAPSKIPSAASSSSSGFKSSAPSTSAPSIGSSARAGFGSTSSSFSASS